MTHRTYKSLWTVATILTCGIAATEATILFGNTEMVVAQSTNPTTFPIPKNLPSGTKIQVDGSSSMATINAALKERWQKQYNGAEVNFSYNGNEAALKELLDNKVNLAGIGRPLTAAQKKQGLVAVPVARHKIAVIVGENNPFRDSLTIEQFAKIFRGEITDWSEIGGKKGKIRFIDRPVDSDIRQSFTNYPIFQKTAFQSSKDAVRVEDETSAIVSQLGNDGISYAIADRVENVKGVRVVPMHKTLPTNPKYPFSQTLTYVYKAPQPNAATQAFLGYATNPENAQVIETAREQAATATVEREKQPTAIAPNTTSDTTANKPDTSATSTSETSATTKSDTSANKTSETTVVTTPDASTTSKKTDSNKWHPLWWLLLPLIGMPLLLWLLKGRHGVAPVAATTDDRKTKLILTPRNCRDAYAYWEIPQEERNRLQQEGVQNLQLRLYDVTDIDINQQAAHSVKEFNCSHNQSDSHLPISVDNRDYLVDLGYINDNGQWSSLARSAHVRVPACDLVDTTPGNVTENTLAQTPGMAATMGTVGTVGAAIAGMGAAANSWMEEKSQNQVGENIPSQPVRLILTPRNCREVYAYWEIPEHTYRLYSQENRQLKLRLYDVTNIDLDYQPPHSVQEFSCQLEERDRHLPVTLENRDYLAELGYVNDDGQWVEIVRSTHVHVPVCDIDENNYPQNNSVQHLTSTN